MYHVVYLRIVLEPFMFGPPGLLQHTWVFPASATTTHHQCNPGSLSTLPLVLSILSFISSRVGVFPQHPTLAPPHHIHISIDDPLQRDSSLNSTLYFKIKSVIASSVCYVLYCTYLHGSMVMLLVFVAL